MQKSTNMRFSEDSFDLKEHRRAADTIIREKARINRVRRQVKIGKIVLAVVTIIIFFILFFVAAELGIMGWR
jgi:hypothetical protein